MPAPPDPPFSPRLAALQAALAAGDPGALARFWAMVERQGTPLIEPLPGTTRTPW